MAFGHLLLCNWLPAFYSSSFPCSDFSASSSKLSCLRRTAATRKKRTINERCRRDHRRRNEEGSNAHSLSVSFISWSTRSLSLSLPLRGTHREMGGNGKGRRGGKWDPCVFLAQRRDDGTMRAMWDGCLSVARRSRSVERRPVRCRPSAAAWPSRALARRAMWQ